MKSYKTRHNEQVYVESLLAKQEQRVEVVESTMDLDTFYIGLGEAAKKLWQDGAITHEQYRARLQELMGQYKSLKANRAA